MKNLGNGQHFLFLVLEICRFRWVLQVITKICNISSIDGFELKRTATRRFRKGALQIFNEVSAAADMCEKEAFASRLELLWTVRFLIVFHIDPYTL